MHAFTNRIQRISTFNLCMNTPLDIVASSDRQRTDKRAALHELLTTARTRRAARQQ
ncbi:hypothetical protein ACNFH5_28825 [Pseudomonas sp. NY15435]|uniref:hypothetical protein n=1 Tax=Pseudomonas sp. NY15435 TaxID=3400358 RepID=UPI003A87575B